MHITNTQNEKRINNTLAMEVAKPDAQVFKERFFITINFHLKEIDIPINDGSRVTTDPRVVKN